MQLIVFDCDGTLVDSQHVIIEAMQTAFRNEGSPEPEPHAVRHIVGLALPEAIARLCADAQRETIDRLVAAYKAAFMELRRRETVRESLYPGARDILIELEKAGYLLGIATGKSRRGLAATLKHHDLQEFFVTLQTADDAPSKPHPEMLRRAMAEVGANAADTALVGDTVFDIEMAQAGGVMPIGVAWGYHDADALWAASACSVLDDFSSLVTALHQGSRSST